jgi:predicted TIM-barrel enzyme
MKAHFKTSILACWPINRARTAPNQASNQAGASGLIVANSGSTPYVEPVIKSRYARFVAHALLLQHITHAVNRSTRAGLCRTLNAVSRARSDFVCASLDGIIAVTKNNLGTIVSLLS